LNDHHLKCSNSITALREKRDKLAGQSLPILAWNASHEKSGWAAPKKDEWHKAKGPPFQAEVYKRKPGSKTAMGQIAIIKEEYLKIVEVRDKFDADLHMQNKLKEIKQELTPKMEDLTILEESKIRKPRKSERLWSITR
jgi:hypothetical protein